MKNWRGKKGKEETGWKNIATCLPYSMSSEKFMAQQQTKQKKGKTMNKELIELAVKLNDARIAANFQDMTAAEAGVYGHIRKALLETLTLAMGEQKANLVYQSLLDGCTVDQAIEANF